MNYPEPYKREDSQYYQFIYVDSKTGKRKRKSTKKVTKKDAKEFIHDFMNELEKNVIHDFFMDYALPYFIWESCPRVKRLLTEGKTIGKTHVLKSRFWLEKYVFTDTEFSTLKLTEIKRHHIINFRERLIKKIGMCNTVNKVRNTIRTIFSEAFLRQDIEKNPAFKIGDIKYSKIERDTFTPEEIQSMFQECPGIWGNLRTYTVFYIAAHTGMRKNEILALSWDKVLLHEKIRVT